MSVASYLFRALAFGMAGGTLGVAYTNDGWPAVALAAVSFILVARVAYLYGQADAWDGGAP